MASTRRRRRGLPGALLLATLPAVLVAASLLASLATGCGTAGAPPAEGGTAGGPPVSSSATVTPTQGTAAVTSPSDGSQGTSVTDITMPQPDSPNISIYQALGWDHVYVLYWLQTEDGWAYVHGIPFTSTDGPTIDTRALLRQDESGAWQVLEKSINEGLLTDVGQVAEDQQIPDQFRSKYPGAPAGIFPEVRPNDTRIMDAVRVALGNPDYRFNVFLLNAAEGWAYTELRALAYEAGRISESREERVLLRQMDGAWKVEELQGMDEAAQADFVGALKQAHPDIPAGVLPEPDTSTEST
jgi:hypothetical protein